MEIDLSECTLEKKEHGFLMKEIINPKSAQVQQQVIGKKTKMLVILNSGEQRLITFDIPTEGCTVHDLLVQGNISLFGSKVSLVNDPSLGVNYIVNYIDLSSRSAGTNSDNDHIYFTSKSTQEIISTTTNNEILSQNINALDENSNTFFTNTKVEYLKNVHLKNLKQKVNHVGQNIVRPKCSNTNKLHVRSAAKVSPKISKTSVKVQENPEMNCLYQQNSSQRQQLSNTVHPVQSSLNLLPSRRSITPNSVQQRTQQVSISPQTQQIQKQPMITSPPSAEQNKDVITSTKMEIDISECKQKTKLVTRQSLSLQLEHEKSSSESVAYLEKIITDPKSAIVQQQVIGKKAKMLVILTSREQRLITFDIPIEDCTVHDLLVQVRAVTMNQVNISFSGLKVSLVDDPALGINYIVDVSSTSPGTNSNTDHTYFTSKSTQEIVSCTTNNEILSQNTNALDENSNIFFTNTKVKYLKNLKQKVINHVDQNIVRPTCSTTNTLHVRPAATVPPKISKTSVRVQDPEINCLYAQNSSQQQLSNMSHPVQSSLNPLSSRRSITPNSVQQRTQQVSISPQTQQIQNQPMITSPAPSAEQNKHVITSTKMEVDIFDCKQEKELITQQSPSLQLEHEKSSSVVYIQETIINDPTSAVVQQQVNGSKAKMLVIAPSGGKNTLITFDILSQYCTVHDLLVAVRALMINQVNISISGSTVFLLDDPALGINYILDVNSRSADTHSDNLDHTDFISKST